MVPKDLVRNQQGTESRGCTVAFRSDCSSSLGCDCIHCHYEPQQYERHVSASEGHVNRKNGCTETIAGLTILLEHSQLDKVDHRKDHTAEQSAHL